MIRPTLLLAAITGLFSCAPLGAQSLEDAMRLAKAGKTAEARQTLETLVRSDPANAEAHFGLGRMAMRERRWPEAAKHLERAANLAPDHAATHLFLGEVYGAQAQEASILGKPGLAAKCRRAFERAVELEPANAAAVQALFTYYLVAPGLLGGGADKAAALTERFKAHDPVLARLLASQIHEQQKDYAGATALVREALALKPDDPLALTRLGGLLTVAGDFEGAFNLFAELAAREPDNLLWKFQLGRTAAVSGQHLEEGVEALTRFLASAPADANPPAFAAHWRLGNLHALRGDTAAARAAYERALELNPAFTPASDDLRKLK